MREWESLHNVERHLNERIRGHKENRYEHILRLTTDMLPKILLNYKPRGEQSIGRPVERWDDIFP
jgi:hypothetical protein